MTLRTITLTDQLHEYLLSVSLRETDIQKKCRIETSELEAADMQIAPEQGQFMSILIKLIGAANILEIGVFTGYSSLWMVSAMGAEGRLTACDISTEWISQAKKYWKQAGIEKQINLRLAPAIETLDLLISQNQAEAYDLCFIDADKENNQNYYEKCLTLTRPGGIILFDNVLWDGKPADETIIDPDTSAIRELNTYLHHDKRIDLTLVPIGDGLTIARKR